jgi:hypothetical protein
MWLLATRFVFSLFMREVRTLADLLHGVSSPPPLFFFACAFRHMTGGRRRPLPPAAMSGEREICQCSQARTLQRRQGLSPLPFHDPFIPDETGKRGASLLPGRTASIRSTARSALAVQRANANQVKAPLLATSKWPVRVCMAHDNFGFFGSEIPPGFGCALGSLGLPSRGPLVSAVVVVSEHRAVAAAQARRRTP